MTNTRCRKLDLPWFCASILGPDHGSHQFAIAAQNIVFNTTATHGLATVDAFYECREFQKFCLREAIAAHEAVTTLVHGFRRVDCHNTSDTTHSVITNYTEVTFF